MYPTRLCNKDVSTTQIKHVYRYTKYKVVTVTDELERMRQEGVRAKSKINSYELAEGEGKLRTATRNLSEYIQ